MKTKHLLMNISRIKKELKALAKNYKLQVSFKQHSSEPYIWVEFTRRKPHGAKEIKLIRLREDKIAYGLYKPALVLHNVERGLIAWLKRTEVVYYEYVKNDAKTDKS